MFDPEFLTMMPHTIQWQSLTGIDSHGNRSYGTARRYRCRVTGKYLPLRTGTADDQAPIFDIFIGAQIEDDGTFTPVGDDVFGPDDLLTLPAGAEWIDGTPEIFAIGRNTDEDGHHHVKIQCGWKYHRQGQ